MLLRHRVTVNARSHNRQFVHGFLHGETFHVGPRVPDLELPQCHLAVQESGEFDVFRLARRFHFLDQLRYPETRPRNGHRPRFHAPETIEPLLERHALDQLVDVVGFGIFYVTFHLHLPGACFHTFRQPGDGLVSTEFVEIIVLGRHFFFCEGSIQSKRRIPTGRVQTHRLIIGMRSPLLRLGQGERPVALGPVRRRHHLAQHQTGAARQKLAAVHEHGFRRRLALGHRPFGLFDVIHVIPFWVAAGVGCTLQKRRIVLSYAMDAYSPSMTAFGNIS